MKCIVAILGLSVIICLLAIGHVANDYSNFRKQIADIKAEEVSNRAVKKQGQSEPSRYESGANIVATSNARQGEQEPSETFVIPGVLKSMKVSDSLIIFLTLAIACFTAGLLREETDKSRKELRAYLGLQNFGVRMIQAGATQMPQIYMDIVNTGSTPARHVRIALKFSNPGINDIFNSPMPDFGPGRRPLTAGGKWTVQRLVRGIGDIDINKINVATRILTWGKISYFDIYDVEQTVTFRLRTDETGGLPDGSFGWTLAATEDGNDAS
jgi:hypothetical protein